MAHEWHMNYNWSGLFDFTHLLALQRGIPKPLVHRENRAAVKLLGVTLRFGLLSAFWRILADTVPLAFLLTLLDGSCLIKEGNNSKPWLFRLSCAVQRKWWALWQSNSFSIGQRMVAQNITQHRQQTRILPQPPRVKNSFKFCFTHDLQKTPKT